MKKVIGFVLLVLAVLFLIPALLRIEDAPNVSHLVGTFLPSLVCAIIGLLLLQNKSSK